MLCVLSKQLKGDTKPDFRLREYLPVTHLLTYLDATHFFFLYAITQLEEMLLYSRLYSC